MTKTISAIWRLAIAGVLAVLVLVLMVNVISQPVDTEVRHYTADFADVSGLQEGADVRVRGVRVGKVNTIELTRRDGQSIARVSLSLDRRYGIGDSSRLAVKYQALTGLRYVDVQNPVDGSPAQTMDTIPLAMTIPSFDITRLFNGLQPVLETLSPEDLNTFTANVENFFAGDGSGLGPVLESIHTLTRFVADRQEVVAVMMQNLKTLADGISGHGSDLVQIIDWANQPIDAAISVLDEFRKSQLYGPDFTSAVVQLLDNAGIKPGIDIDAALDRAFTNFDDTIDAIKFVPVIWENIPPPSAAGEPIQCSKGRADLPLPVDVLINGQKVVLCNP